MTIDQFTDDELTNLALALDVDTPVSCDAVPISYVLGSGAAGPLPEWYLPARMGVRRLGGWRGRVVSWSAVSVIASFVVINAAGLCNTYGQLHF